MPLTDAYPCAVVFISIWIDDAWKPVGTGFFVGLPRPDGGIFRYLVTAAHVVNHGYRTAMRLRHVDGSVTHEPVGDWIPHARSDVAVARIGDLAPDAIAMFTEWERFADIWTRQHDSEIVVGDQVYFIGLLTNVPSMIDQSIPMVRSGHIGALYQDDIPARDGPTLRYEPVAT